MPSAIKQYLAALGELEQQRVKGKLASSLEALFRGAYNYPAEKAQVLHRYRQLLESCDQWSNKTPVFLARAPGRINLIGEHIDYNGCPVLPLAVDRDILAAAIPHTNRSSGKTQIILRNLDMRFSQREFPISRQSIPFAPGDWGNYCKAGIQGVLDYCRKAGFPTNAFQGFSAVLSGNIPQAAGLSSSSALVVLCAILFLKVNRLEMDRSILAAVLAQSEQYVGTAGGGMDQAVCLLGKKGCALKTGFDPLVVTPVPLPEAYTIVALHSTVQAEKTGNARLWFNTRVAECRIATAIIDSFLKTRYGSACTLSALGKLPEPGYGITREELKALINTLFHTEPYTLPESAAMLSLSPEDLETRYFHDRNTGKSYFPAAGLKLYQRAHHVITEWQRVESFCAYLASGAYHALGALLSESHTSLSRDYEVSCPELDKLVEIAGAGGAVGSRLTGAGFGGFTLSLVENDKLESFLAFIVKHYYQAERKFYSADYRDYIFTCKPVDGSWIICNTGIKLTHL